MHKVIGLYVAADRGLILLVQLRLDLVMNHHFQT